MGYNGEKSGHILIRIQAARLRKEGYWIGAGGYKIASCSKSLDYIWKAMHGMEYWVAWQLIYDALYDTPNETSLLLACVVLLRFPTEHSEHSLAVNYTLSPSLAASMVASSNTIYHPKGESCNTKPRVVRANS